MIQRRLLPFMVFVLAIASAYGQKTSTFIPEPGEGFSFNSSALMVSGAPGEFSPGTFANSQEIHFTRDNVFGISHFSWAWGLGYSAHFYHGNLHLDVSEDGTMTPIYLTGNDHSNRFATEYLDASLELRYRGNVNNRGRYNRFYVGALFGYRTDSYSYYKDQNYRVKFYNIAGFNPYRYGVYAKAGRGPVNVFGFYGLSPLVVDGPLLDTWQEARSLNLGMSITL